MAFKKQVEIPETKPTHEEDSYTVLTAQNLLRHFALEFSEADVRDQLKMRDSFYRQVLRAPAYDIYNRLLSSHCRDLRDYCQELIVNLIMTKTPTPEGMVSEADQEFDRIRKQFGTLNDRYQRLSEQQQALSEKTDETAKAFIAEWQKAVDGFVQEICLQLRDKDYAVPAQFPSLLREHLLRQGAGVEIAPEVLRSLKLKSTPGPIETAVIAALLEVSHE